MIEREENLRYSVPIITFISLGDIRTAGIRYISALLKKQGWKTNIIIYKLGYFETDIPTQKEENILIGLLKDLNTDIVGISVKTPFLRNTINITSRIKEELNVPVIWGGSHPTILPEESINYADVVCIGEGEYPFVEFIERGIINENREIIQNLWIKKNGTVMRNSIRPLLQTEKLDGLPFPDCGDNNVYVINNDRMLVGDPLNKTIEYYPMASRGCPFKCSFCINGILGKVYHNAGTFVRFRSPENVVKEIVNVVERFPGVKRIRFQDEVFPWKKNWIERFCEEYKKKVGLPFLCTFHPNVLNEDVIRMLKSAGLMVVGFGIQSPSERIRKEVFHRPDKDETILKSIEILHRNKLEGHYDIILDNPFENELDKKDGLNFLLKIPRPYNITAFALKFFPGYKITDEALKKGLIAESEVKAMCSQGYFELYYNWYAPRKKEDLFWNCLYLLASRTTVPHFLVKMLYRWKFLMRHPKQLIAFVKLTWYPELLVIGIRRLIRGQMNPLNLIRVMKSKALKQTV